MEGQADLGDPEEDREVQEDSEAPEVRVEGRDPADPASAAVRPGMALARPLRRRPHPRADTAVLTDRWAALAAQYRLFWGF